MGLRVMLVWLGLRIMFLCIYALVGWLFVDLARPLMRRGGPELRLRLQGQENARRSPGLV